MIICSLYGKKQMGVFDHCPKLNFDLCLICDNEHQARKLIETNNGWGLYFDVSELPISFSEWLSCKCEERKQRSSTDSKLILLMDDCFNDNFSDAIKLMGVYDRDVNIAVSLAS